MKRFSYIFTSFIYLIYSYTYLEILGIIGIVWCAAWWFLVYDSPVQHPRISEEEKAYILQAIGDKVQNSKNSKVITILSQILSISANNALSKHKLLFSESSVQKHFYFVPLPRDGHITLR